jgi:parvulin-like peptidyl-prolyl isomerase
MLFQHINRHADKHRKRVYLALVILIGLSFVVFVTPRGCNDVGRANGKSKIGTMFGKPVTQAEFVLAMHKADLGYYLRNGRWLSGSRQNGDQVTQETIRRLTAVHEARRQGLDAVSTDEFNSYVKSRPAFQTDGAFDGDKLKTLRDNIIRGMKITGHGFDQVIRDNIAIDRLEAKATAGIVVSPVEVRDLFNRENEKLVLNYAEISVDPAENGDPDQAELDAYFAAHKDELHLPDKRVLRIASVPVVSDPAKVEIPEQELKDAYEKMKATLYKGKTFEQARGAIRARLLPSKTRKNASDKADALIAKLQKRPEGETLADLAKRFDALAKEAGATVKDTEPFLGTDQSVPGFEKAGSLAFTTRSLSEAAPLPKTPTSSGGAFLVPIYLKTIPGAKAEKLADVRDDVVDAVLAEKAKALYKEKVAPFADQVKGMTDINDLVSKALEKVKDKSMEERMAAYKDTNTLVSRYLRPVFKPEQRTFWLVTFDDWRFRDQVKVTDEQVRDYYDAHPKKYDQDEIRASQIMVRLVPGADEKAKKAAHDRIQGYLERIRKGEDFAEVAVGSDDMMTRKKGGDMGFERKGVRPPDVDAALAKLEVGELSDIVETSNSLLILKCTGKRHGTPLKEAAAEIRNELIGKETRLLAQDKAADFSDAVTMAFETATKALGAAASDKAFLAAGQDVFTKVAEQQEVQIRKIDQPLAKNDNVPGLGRPGSLGTEIFSLMPAMPITTAVEVNGRQCVALLTGTIPGRLYDLDKEADVVVDKLKPVVRKELARSVADKQAKALQEALAAAIEKDGKVPEKIDETEIKTTEPFTRGTPDRDVPGIRDVMDAIDKGKTKAGEILAPIEEANSFVLVRVQSRTLPAEADFDDDAKSRIKDRLEWTKSAVAKETLYRRLEKEADANLLGITDANRK